MPTRARAVQISEPGGPEVLEIGEIDIADPGASQILVEVAAAGLNRADTLQRRGFYPAPPGAPADIPGLEYAGTVAAVGPQVQRWKVGDRVMGITGGGGMATHLVVHEREAIAVPGSLPLDQAAAIPEVFMTAFDAMFVRGRAVMGEWMLIHAAASGVGTAAIQLATVAGIRAIGTSRTRSKLDRLGELGLEHPVHVEGGRFAEATTEITGGRGADVILDFIGAAYLAENLEAAAPLGRLVVIGLMGGVKGEIPLAHVLRKRLTMTGTVLRARPLEEKASLAQRFAAEVVPLFESGKLRPIIDTTAPMDEISAMHARMEANESVGKIVLTW